MGDFKQYLLSLKNSLHEMYDLDEARDLSEYGGNLLKSLTFIKDYLDNKHDNGYEGYSILYSEIDDYIEIAQEITQAFDIVFENIKEQEECDALERDMRSQDRYV